MPETPNTGSGLSSDDEAWIEARAASERKESRRDFLRGAAGFASGVVCTIMTIAYCKPLRDLLRQKDGVVILKEEDVPENFRVDYTKFEEELMQIDTELRKNADPKKSVQEKIVTCKELQQKTNALEEKLESLLSRPDFSPNELHIRTRNQISILIDKIRLMERTLRGIEPKK